MARLTFIEKEIIYRLFGIGNGYLFNYVKGYTKTISKNIILDACNINIYEDEEFKDLSQQKCFEKICNEKSSLMIAKLLRGLCDYFCFYMGDSFWSNEDGHDYAIVESIIERLEKENDIDLEIEANDDLHKFIVDIKDKVRTGNPEMALDRLHTFSTKYLRNICERYSLDIKDTKGNYYPLHSLAGNLKKYYSKENYFESEFCGVAIQTSINIFDKFNSIRNEQSAAHANKILNEIEANYAVRIRNISFY